MNKPLNVFLIASLLLAACAQAKNAPGLISGSADPIQARIVRVENGLIPLGEGDQFQWGNPASLAERMQHYGLPGLSVAVIENYQLEWARGYGVFEAGGDQPVTPNSLFHAGSIAKPVSAAAALMLVAGGQLDLDREVNEQLTAWQVPENEYTSNEKVSLRRLLSHSSGLTDGYAMRSSSDPEFNWWMAAEGEAPGVTIPQLLEGQTPSEQGDPTRVTRVPGSAYEYSNFGYGVVELLIEEAAQRDFAVLMQETVLTPLEMTSSTFEQPLPARLRSRAVSEHYVSGEPFAEKRHHFPIRAAGGLWTTPSDLARFAIEIMRTYQGDSDLLLSQPLAVEMLTPQIEIPDQGFIHSYGLGFDLGGQGQSFFAEHTGGTWGSTALLWFYPETGQGAVIMTNSAANQGAIRFELLMSIAKEYGWPLWTFMLLTNRVLPVWGMVTLLSLVVLVWLLIRLRAVPWKKKLLWLPLVGLLGPLGLLAFWLFMRHKGFVAR